MSRSILLTFDTKKLRKTNPKLNPADFSVSFNKELNLVESEKRKWYASLFSAKIYNSIFNITSERGNNTLSYTIVGAPSYTTITFLDGIYGFIQLDREIKRQLKENGDTQINPDTGETEYPFKLEIDEATLSFYFSFNQIAGFNYEVKIDRGINQILGYDPEQIILFSDSFENRLSPNRPDVSLGLTDNVTIETNLIADSYLNGVYGQILYGFTFDNQPGSLLEINPINPIRLPCVYSGNKLIRVDIQIKNGLREIANLNGENVIIFIELRLF